MCCVAKELYLVLKTPNDKGTDNQGVYPDFFLSVVGNMPANSCGFIEFS